MLNKIIVHMYNFICIFSFPVETKTASLSLYFKNNDNSI